MSKQGEKKDKTNILSLDNIRQRHEETFKMSEAYVELDGEMLSYKMYDKFPQSIKDEYNHEIIEFMMDTVTSEEGVNTGTTVFIHALLIDKFTDLDLPDDNQGKIEFASYLADFDILIDIINTFDEDEVNELLAETNKAINIATERAKEILEENENYTGDIEDLSSLRLVEEELENTKSEE